MAEIAACLCGCGGIPTRRQYRWLQGHWRRSLGTDGYPERLVNGRRMRAHRHRAELALGHPLPAGATVHHVDGSKSPHAPLVICQDEAYHHGLHRRLRVLRAGGRPFLDHICASCKKVRPLEQFHRDRHAWQGHRNYCKCCHNDRVNARRLADLPAFNARRRERYRRRHANG